MLNNYILKYRRTKLYCTVVLIKSTPSAVLYIHTFRTLYHFHSFLFL
jgi:hypothetical protein